MREQPGQDRSNHRAGTDETYLRRIGERPLFFRNGIGDERPEGLHGDVGRTGKQPQHDDRCPQAVNVGHQYKSNRANDRAAKYIGPPPAKRTPCPVAQMTDDGLNEKARNGARDPQDRQLIETRTERLENTAGVNILETPDDLHAEESAAHVGDGSPRKFRYRCRRKIVRNFGDTGRLQIKPFGDLSRCSQEPVA